MIGRGASPGPVFDYRLTVLIDRELDNIPDSVLIVFIDRNEPKGLLSAGERRQHFGCAEDCSCVGQEHEVDAGALIERALQVQQSAGDGNDLQFASNTESALEAKDSRGWVGKLQAGRSRIGFRWQEISHSQNQLCSPSLEQGTLLKLLPEK
jgi:hypothetical protein